MHNDLQLSTSESSLTPYRYGVTFTLRTMKGDDLTLTRERAEKLATLLSQNEPPRFVTVTTESGVVLLNTNTITELAPDEKRAKWILFCLEDGASREYVDANLNREDWEILTDDEWEYFNNFKEGKS